MEDLSLRIAEADQIGVANQVVASFKVPVMLSQPTRCPDTHRVLEKHTTTMNATVPATAIAQKGNTTPAVQDVRNHVYEVFVMVMRKDYLQKKSIPIGKIYII